MVYTPRDAEANDESVEDIQFPRYSIFNSDEDSEGLSMLNFSLHTAKSCFPDYTAERKYSDGEVDFWAVRNGSGEIEASINRNYDSKEELAYKLQNVYDAVK